MTLRHTSIVFVPAGALAIGTCRRDTADHRSGASQTKTTQTRLQETMATVNEVAQKVQRFPIRPGEFLDFVPPKRQPQNMILVAMPVRQSPTIDGRADEPFWATASAITTRDFSSQRPITLKSVYTTDTVFFW